MPSWNLDMRSTGIHSRSKHLKMRISLRAATITDSTFKSNNHGTRHGTQSRARGTSGSHYSFAPFNGVATYAHLNSG